MEENCEDKEIEKIIDEKIKEFVATGVNPNNLDALYKLVDIKKDFKKIELMEKKGEENEVRKWL